MFAQSSDKPKIRKNRSVFYAEASHVKVEIQNEAIIYFIEQ